MISHITPLRTARPRERPPVDYQHLRLIPGSRNGKILAVLVTPDGRIPLKKLGEGHFSAVYLDVSMPSRVFAFETNDSSDKEVAATVHERLPDNPHVPAVKRFGATQDRNVYTMPLYRVPLREHSCKRGWRDFKTMRSVWTRAMRPAWEQTDVDDKPLNRLVVRHSAEQAVTPGVVEALDHLTRTAARKSPTYAIEFRSPNLASDARRRLVLLDVLWDRRHSDRLP